MLVAKHRATASIKDRKRSVRPILAAGLRTWFMTGATRCWRCPRRRLDDNGGKSAARFFYCAKADRTDGFGSSHPTIKPVDLMRYLVRLVTPPGGHVLDPFAGSGTTDVAALAEGFDATLIEREAECVADIRRRQAHVAP
jgi:DNA modification methylase